MTDPRRAARAGGGRRAARPKDAATLILVRRDAGGPRVLMGQRHSGHAFMPNKFVFPGGRVDAADSRVRPASELRPEVEARLCQGCSPGRARALAMAAIRETFEETGLLVGLSARVVPRTRSSAWAGFLRHGVVPALEPLEFVARAITPPFQSRRFDARFFMADAVHIQGDLHESLSGSGELLDLHWVPLDDARRLDLPQITRLVIDEIAKRLALPPFRARELPVPFVRDRRGKPVMELIR